MRLAGCGFALGQPHEVEPFWVGHQQVAEILAGREDLQQRGHGFRVALEERAGGERISRRPHKPFQIVQGHIGVGRAGQVFFELIAHDGQQVQRHAGRGHAQQVAVRPADVDDPQPGQPRGRGSRIVEILAEGCDFHNAALSGRSDNFNYQRKGCHSCLSFVGWRPCIVRSTAGGQPAP